MSEQHVTASEMEVLLNNRLDSKFQYLILPSHIIGYLCFSPRYIISNNYITPNGKISNLITVFGLLVFLSLTGLRLYSLICAPYKSWLSFLTKIMLFIDQLYYGLFYLVHAVNKVKSSMQNVQIVMSIQSIYRSLTMSKMFQRLLFRSASTYLVYLLIIMTTYISTFLFVDHYEFGELIYDMLISNFDWNILYGINMMVLLRKFMEDWSIQLKACEASSEIQTNEGECVDKLFQCYVEIMKVFTLIEKSMQEMILLHYLDTIIRNLLYISLIIDTYRYYNNGLMTLATFSVSIIRFVNKILKNFILDSLLAWEYEMFYVAVEKAQVACKISMWSSKSVPIRRMCKNVVRSHRASFRRVVACGVCSLELTLAFNILAFMTNYTVIILQFKLCS